mmetsp:Transcript_125107/g.350318  ORF Transcript_125107/g.350318 Transcript_125107/m.350318 type:complete len:358 (+) Transcript_125107:287-1360(+)
MCSLEHEPAVWSSRRGPTRGMKRLDGGAPMWRAGAAYTARAVDLCAPSHCQSSTKPSGSSACGRGPGTGTSRAAHSASKAWSACDAVQRSSGSLASMPTRMFSTSSYSPWSLSKPSACEMEKCRWMTSLTLSRTSPLLPSFITLAASLAMSAVLIFSSTVASVGTSPPNIILAKTSPNCQTFPAVPPEVSRVSGAWRNSEPLGNEPSLTAQSKRSSAVSCKHAWWKFVITARRSPSTRYTFASDKSPWTMLRCSMLWMPRSRSIMSGSACCSGTAGCLFARAERSLTKASSVRPPTYSVIMKVASAKTCRSKKVGTQPVWLRSWDARSSRMVSGASERPAEMRTRNSGLARSFAVAM